MTGPMEPNDERPRLNAGMLAMAVIVAAVLALAVASFARFGGPFITSLDNRLGDLVAARAAGLERAGNIDAAVATYRDALSRRFEDPAQHALAYRRLGALLLDEGEPAQALETLSAGAENFPQELPLLELASRAALQAGAYGDLEAYARQWGQAAAEAGSSQHVALASYHLGRAAENLGRPEEALEAYLAGCASEPDGVNAYHAGKLLAARGDEAGARARLTAFLSGQPAGARAEDAAALLKRLSN